MKANPKNPKDASNWGYELDDSPRAVITQKTKLLPGANKTVIGVVLGGEIHNISEAVLWLYKGKTATGDFVKLEPNQKYVPTKGYSWTTILNTSDSITAFVNVQIRK